MVRREDLMHPICWLCCCGGLPFYGLLKGLICVIPCTLSVTLSATAISLVLLPYDFFHIYWAIAKTKIVGPNITIVAMFLLPLPLLAWPILVLIVSFSISFFYSLFAPVCFTFDRNYDLLCGGVARVYNDCFYDFIPSFWKFNYISFTEFARGFREYQLLEGEKPFDIPIYWIILGPIYAAFGILVDLPAAALISVFKFIPTMCRAYYELWVWYCKLDQISIIGFSLCFVAGNALLPFGMVLAVAVFLVYSIVLAFTAPGAAFLRGLEAGIKRIFNNVYDMDKVTNELAFDKKNSCLECWNFGENMW